MIMIRGINKKKELQTYDKSERSLWYLQLSRLFRRLAVYNV